MAIKTLSEEHKKRISESMKGNFNGHSNKGRTSPMLGRTHSDESKSNMSKIRNKLISENKIKQWNKGLTAKEDSRIPRGERCGAWKGGITPERKLLRNSAEYLTWRKNVFSRDKYICQECNQIGGDLEVHHIKSFANYPDLRLDINNGITYCKLCHSKIDVHRRL